MALTGGGMCLSAMVKPKPTANRPKIDRNLYDRSVVYNIRYQIAPYIIAAELLADVPEYTIYRLYTYVRSLLAAIVGLGIAPPILRYLDTKTPELGGQVPSSEPFTISNVSYVGLAALICLTAFWVYVNQYDLDKRAVLADSCIAQFKGFYLKLLRVITANNAGAELNSLSNEIATVVQRQIAEKAWTFEHVLASGIDDQAEALTDFILSQIPPNNASKDIQQRER